MEYRRRNSKNPLKNPNKDVFYKVHKIDKIYINLPRWPWNDDIIRDPSPPGASLILSWYGVLGPLGNWPLLLLLPVDLTLYFGLYFKYYSDSASLTIIIISLTSSVLFFFPQFQNISRYYPRLITVGFRLPPMRIPN